MASPRSVAARQSASYGQRYHRSSFNGAKRLHASGAKNRWMLFVVGLLVLALIAALVVVAVHLGGNPAAG